VPDGSARLVGSRSPTLVDVIAPRLSNLCSAAGFGAHGDEVVRTFRSLVSPWGDAPAKRSSTWMSEISDDNTPIELSVAITDGEAEVRVLFEAQAKEPTLQAHRVAGIAQIQRLEREHGADLGRLRLVQDLFLPEHLQGAFAVWISVVFSAGRAPSFKAYFNAQAQGPERGPALVEEALVRLGFRRAWGALTRAALRRGPHLDEIKYFALDLTPGPKARVKVYVHHHAATPEDLERACETADSYVPGEALEFARAMRGGDERLMPRAPFTCDSFLEELDDRPAATTLYVPICAYARDDDAARARVREHLVAEGSDPALYEAILRGFANRPLDAGVGMQSWVAHRRDQGRSRLTVYLGTEVNRICAPGTIPAATPDRTTFTSAEGVLQRTSDQSFAEHPFVQRMKRQPDQGGPVWLMIANLYEGTSVHFIRWLSMVTARVEDDRMRCLLARQLDQELGEGDFSRAHSVLMLSFLKAIEPLRPPRFVDAHLDSGRRLGQRLARHYLSDDPLEGVAALLAGEICAQQLIRVIAQQLRSEGNNLDPAMIDWLTLHDEIEGDHAEESFTLARMIPSEAGPVAVVQRGAEGVHVATWRALDELYELCFG
jgi:pyrroloquinoline quinone (PQQ) biosynthesis protein C/NTP pyrophosphatase (non-canonical NTP hydrolase)